MVGGSAAAHGGEHIAEGIIAKAAKSTLRDAVGAGGRSAARAGAKDAARAGTKDAGTSGLLAAERDLAKSAGKSGARTGSRDAGAAARRKAIRNESGLPVGPGTAEARRAYDKLHGTQPDWGRTTEGYHGPRPADMARPHGHHIVFKEGPPGPIRDVVDESKTILERNGVDWYTGGENLIWAENRGHSLANAQRVRDMLAAAEKDGPQAVRDALRNAGRHVFGGRP